MEEGGPEGWINTSEALWGMVETNKQIINVPNIPTKVKGKVNLHFGRKPPDTRGVAQWDTGCLVSQGSGFGSQERRQKKKKRGRK